MASNHWRCFSAQAVETIFPSIESDANFFKNILRAAEKSHFKIKVFNNHVRQIRKSSSGTLIDYLKSLWYNLVN